MRSKAKAYLKSEPKRAHMLEFFTEYPVYEVHERSVLSQRVIKRVGHLRLFYELHVSRLMRANVLFTLEINNQQQKLVTITYIVLSKFASYSFSAPDLVI